MNMRSFLVSLLFLALPALSGGCAGAPPLKAFQGHPHTTISGAPRQMVVERLISAMQSRRYELKHYTFLRDQGYRIQFVKDESGAAGGLMLSLLEPPAAARLGVVYEVRESGEGLRISARVVAEEAFSAPDGKARELINAENHRIQEILAGLKAAIEGK